MNCLNYQNQQGRLINDEIMNYVKHVHESIEDNLKLDESGMAPQRKMKALSQNLTLGHKLRLLEVLKTLNLNLNKGKMTGHSHVGYNQYDLWEHPTAYLFCELLTYL